MRANPPRGALLGVFHTPTTRAHRNAREQAGRIPTPNGGEIIPGDSDTRSVWWCVVE